LLENIEAILTIEFSKKPEHLLKSRSPHQRIQGLG
jgi:hypothetical protein